MIALARRSATAALLWVALSLLVPAPAAAETQASGRVVERVHRAHYLSDRDLDALTREFCSTEEGVECRHWMSSPGYVRLSTTEEVQDRFADWLKVRDVPPPTQVFHVHLFAADNEPQAGERVPEALAPVLKDLASFLPFRSFHLISTGLVRTSREGRVDLGSERNFRVDLRFAGDPAGGKPLQIENFELVRREMVPGEGGAAQVANFDVLRTSFSINVGETVVVGTSKMDGGDKALVVLLTAAK